MTANNKNLLVTMLALVGGIAGGFAIGAEYMTDQVYRKTKHADRLLADRAADEGKPWYARGKAPYERLWAKVTGKLLPENV